MRSMKLTSVLVAFVACVSLAACGASPSDQATGSTTASSTSASSTTASSLPAGKVSANTASESEIATALQAAGVSNPERWAREVVEYRPYAADDSNLTTLRDNLAKYNPGEDTVNKIVSALAP